MNQSTDTTRQPPQELMAAMEKMRTGDHRGAIQLAEAALPTARDRVPFLALAGLGALRAREPARAIPHLRELLDIRPEDNASRLNLANALIETGDLDGALALARQAPDGVLARVEGFVLQQRGEMEEAATAYRRAVQNNPADLASWNNLANVFAARGEFAEAIEAFRQAITIAPVNLELYLNLADVLRRADRGEARLKVMRDAQELAPLDRRVLTELAMAQAHVEDLDGAVATLEDAVARYPEFGESHIELGRLYEALNRVDDLAAFIERTDLSNAPPEAAFLFAWQAQRENRFDDAAALAETIPETIHPMRRLHLVGSIADRRDDAATAFSAFTSMNAEALADSPPREGPSFRESIEEDLCRWSPGWAASWNEVEIDDGPPDPIFLVGFPRSGTTLLDTMLMGLPQLSVLEEKPMIARLLHALGDADLAQLPADRIVELRASYFASAREFGWDEERWLLDKHPLNMVRAPLIHRLFPRARFILAERHPYDVVLSCFMANFQLNFAMRSFTELDEAARTYDAVFSSWERARALFAIDAHPVRYERLVEDSRAELAPLVRWLGLEWDDRLLAHDETAKTRGRVRTASYSQIGEALYTRARYRWRRYADQLAPVIPILRPWAARLEYEAG